MNSDVIDFASLAPAYPEMLLALGAIFLLVMGVVIFYAALIILLNLLVDILYAKLDPRVRY